jgi:hypothetical protein
MSGPCGPYTSRLFWGPWHADGLHGRAAQPTCMVGAALVAARADPHAARGAIFHHLAGSGAPKHYPCKPGGRPCVSPMGGGGPWGRPSSPSAHNDPKTTYLCEPCGRPSPNGWMLLKPTRVSLRGHLAYLLLLLHRWHLLRILRLWGLVLVIR